MMSRCEFRKLSCTTGPTSVRRSVGSPTVSFLVSAMSNSRNDCRTSDITITLLAAVHFCPADKKADRAVCRAASARSASANTTIAFFPPSSNCTGALRAPAALATSFPTRVEPVKDTAATRGSPVRASPEPTVSSSSVLRTPLGNPASMRQSVSAREVRGVQGDGFQTTVLPAMRAAESLTAGLEKGKFHGVMARTTPRGSRRVKANLPAPSVSPTLPVAPHGWATPIN